MDREKVRELAKKYNLNENQIKEMLKQPSKKERIESVKKEIEGKKFELKKWAPPKDNPDWSHDHCEICNKEISDLEETENEAYGDEENSDWICKSCFEDNKKKLGF